MKKLLLVLPLLCVMLNTFSMEQSVSKFDELNNAFCSSSEALNLSKEELTRIFNQDVNELDERGCTSAHYAAVYGSVRVLQKLKARGADLNLANKIGDTPLSLSLINKREDAFKYLLKEDLKEGQESVIKMFGDFTLPMLAAKYEVPKRMCNQLLRAIFAKCALQDKENGTSSSYKDFLDKKDLKNGNTALILAAQNEHSVLVTELLNLGADRELTNDHGYKAVSVASHPFNNGKQPIVDSLKKN